MVAKSYFGIKFINCYCFDFGWSHRQAFIEYDCFISINDSNQHDGSLLVGRETFTCKSHVFMIINVKHTKGFDTVFCGVVPQSRSEHLDIIKVVVDDYETFSCIIHPLHSTSHLASFLLSFPYNSKIIVNFPQLNSHKIDILELYKC